MLYALLALVLILVLILFLSLNIHILYEGEAPAIYLKVLFLKINLYPGAPPSPHKLKKEKQKKRKKKAKSSDTKEEPAKKKSLAEIRDIIDTVLTLLSALKDKFLSALKVTAAKIYISVGSDNAAKTALLYGGICQGVTYLLELLDNITNLKTVKKTIIHVGCDFSVAETKADIHLILSMRIYRLLGLALNALKTFIMIKLKKDFKNTKRTVKNHE